MNLLTYYCVLPPKSRSKKPDKLCIVVENQKVGQGDYRFFAHINQGLKPVELLYALSTGLSIWFWLLESNENCLKRLNQTNTLTCQAIVTVGTHEYVVPTVTMAQTVGVNTAQHPTTYCMKWVGRYGGKASQQ